MCDRNKSCSVIEDEGLQAAYTLAHELGNAQPLVFFLFCFFLCVCFIVFCPALASPLWVPAAKPAVVLGGLQAPAGAGLCEQTYLQVPGLVEMGAFVWCN